MDELMETPFALAKEKVQEYIPAPPRVSNRIPERAALPVAPAPKIEPEVLPVVNTQTNAKLTRILTLSEGLTIGSQGEEVRLLQQELGFTGDDIDGKFGGKTNSLLKSKIAGLREHEENIKLLQSPNVKAFLSVLRIKESGNRYNIVTGGKIKFTDYSDHPRTRVGNSDAAGGYQFLSRTWDALAKKLELNDFTPSAQDLAAVSLLRQIGAISQLQSGNLNAAIFKTGSQWDAFPINEDGAGIGDRYSSKPVIRSLDKIKVLYNQELDKINAIK